MIIIVQKTIMILYVFIPRILRIDVYTDTDMSNMVQERRREFGQLRDPVFRV